MAFRSGPPFPWPAWPVPGAGNAHTPRKNFTKFGRHEGLINYKASCPRRKPGEDFGAYEASCPLRKPRVAFGSSTYLVPRHQWAPGAAFSQLHGPTAKGSMGGLCCIAPRSCAPNRNQGGPLHPLATCCAHYRHSPNKFKFNLNPRVPLRYR